MKYKYSELLNRLDEMQRSPYYATARCTLADAELAIVFLETELVELRKITHPAPVNQQLLEALKQMVESVAGVDQISAVNEARAAIAQAEKDMK